MLIKFMHTEVLQWKWATDGNSVAYVLRQYSRHQLQVSNQEMKGKLLRNLAFSSQLLDVQLVSTSSALPQLCCVYP